MKQHVLKENLIEDRVASTYGRRGRRSLISGNVKAEEALNYLERFDE